MIFITAQILGLLGSGSTIVATQMKSKKNYLFAYTIAYVLLIANMILLKAYAGVINCLILMILTLISTKYENKKFPTWLVITFSLIILIGSIITFENIYSLLPTIASYAYWVILLSKDMKTIRRCTFLLKLLWAIYDFLIMAYTTCALDCFGVISSVIAMIRYDRKHEPQQNIQKF